MFIREQVFGRLEKEILTADEYIETKQNLPITGIPYRASPNVYRFQERKVEELETYLRYAQALFGLPDRKREIFREVRLDTGISRVFRGFGDYEQFKQGNVYSTHPLTICDFIVKYSKEEIYIVEVKVQTSFESVNNWQTIAKSKRKAKRQLSRAALFFINNFRVFPVLIKAQLIRGKESERLPITHYQFDNNKLNPILQLR